MSRLVGHVRVEPVSDGQEGGGEVKAAVHVAASVAGLELHCDPRVTLEPHEARALRALVDVGIEEVERMRAQALVKGRNEQGEKRDEGRRRIKTLLLSLDPEQIAAVREALTNSQAAEFDELLAAIELMLP